jgi:RimJ/RimL family protein N-acetyltransferase
VARYQDWDETFALDDAERFLILQDGKELGEPGTWVQLAAEERSSGEVVGDCASKVRERGGTAEIGMTLATAHQGRGLATEMTSALVAALFDEHGLHRVVAHADDRNESVQRLLDRLGFRLEARFVEADRFKGEWATLRVYALLAREWRAATCGPASSDTWR